MKMDRFDQRALLALVPNPRSPFWNLTEAIKREALFTTEFERFDKREMYMMCDIVYRPHQPASVFQAVDQMLTNHGVE